MTFEDDLDPDLLWELMWVGRPPDTHFSASGSSPLARTDDTNKLETHATLAGRAEEDEDDEAEVSDLLKIAGGIGLGVLLAIGAVKAAPRVKAWWKKRRANKPALSAEAGPAVEAVSSEVVELSVAAFASKVEEALDDQREKMSSAEAQRRILEIMLAAAVIAANVRALSTAQLEDGATEELHSALEKLTAQQVTDSLNRVLEMDGTLLSEQASADLMKVFGGGCAVEGEYVSLRHDRVRDVLHLPRAA